MIKRSVILGLSSLSILFTSFCVSKNTQTVSERDPSASERSYKVIESEEMVTKAKSGDLIVHWEVRESGHVVQRYLQIYADCQLEKPHKVYEVEVAAYRDSELVGKDVVTVVYDVHPPSPVETVGKQLYVVPAIPMKQNFNLKEICTYFKKLQKG